MLKGKCQISYSTMKTSYLLAQSNKLQYFYQFRVKKKNSLLTLTNTNLQNTHFLNLGLLGIYLPFQKVFFLIIRIQESGTDFH